VATLRDNTSNPENVAEVATLRATTHQIQSNLSDLLFGKKAEKEAI